jgi:hypothetical protein
MPRRVFLHVGSPKTGTTFLQDLLWSQRERALEQGLLLPMSSLGDHLRAALDLRGDRGYVPDPDRIPGAWKSLVDEAVQWPGDVLVSHELFAPTPEPAARGAVAELSNAAEVHVVVTARDLARQLPAHWQENIKARGTESFAEFMATVREDGERKSWFWQVQDYPAILERWGGDLPREQVHVVTLPPAGGPSHVLWERFASLVGLDPTSFDLGGPRRNESLGAQQIELLRRINNTLGERLSRPGPYPSVVKGLLAHQVLASQRGARLALNDTDSMFAVECSRSLVERLRAGGVNVIGDLSELVPDPTASSVRADRVPAGEEVLDSSIEALVSLLERIHEQGEQRKETVGQLRRELRDCQRQAASLRRELHLVNDRRWNSRIRRRGVSVVHAVRSRLGARRS